jgi:hypothetical protein
VGSIALLASDLSQISARYVGVDVNPVTKQFRRDGVEIVIGDQANPDFWEEFKVWTESSF